jgi:hypothetical protein
MYNKIIKYFDAILNFNNLNLNSKFKIKLKKKCQNIDKITNMHFRLFSILIIQYITLITTQKEPGMTQLLT